MLSADHIEDVDLAFAAGTSTIGIIYNLEKISQHSIGVICCLVGAVTFPF